MLRREAGSFASRTYECCKIIVAGSGDKIYWNAEAGGIFTGVMGRPTDGYFDLARVRILGNQRTPAAPHDIDIDGADADDIGSVSYTHLSCKDCRRL